MGDENNKDVSKEPIEISPEDFAKNVMELQNEIIRYEVMELWDDNEWKRDMELYSKVSCYFNELTLAKADELRDELTDYIRCFHQDLGRQRVKFKS